MDLFFDTNAIPAMFLHQLQGQQDKTPEYELWQAIKDGRIKGYMAGFALPTVFGLVENEYKDKYRRAGWHWQKAERQARRDAYNLVVQCTNYLYVCDLQYSYIEMVKDLMSKDLVCNDFEDNLQIITAFKQRVYTLITHNKRDFGCAIKFGVSVISPSQALNMI